MATNVSWMPAHGRHRVNVGTSLGRALKARKGTTAATKRHNLPDRDFYSFRCRCPFYVCIIIALYCGYSDNFKPPSIDSTKPGTIDVKRGKDSTSVTVEHSSSQVGEGHLFVGSEQVAKETDCVLIYDEETGTFTLEKLDSYMTLTHGRKTATNPTRPSTSPLPAPLPTPSTSNEPIRDLDLEARLERDLLDMEMDADGEPDNEFEETASYNIAALREEEEEEEEEEKEETLPPREPSPPKSKVARHVRPSAKSTPHPSSSAKYKTPARSKAKARKEAAALEVEAEDLEFGQPARQTKRIRPSPPSTGLALPGSSSIVDAPSAIYYSIPHKSSITPISAPQPGSDSEEDWDEVQPVLTAAQEIISADEGEDEEEIDMTAFEAEMNQQLNGSDDFLAPAVLSESEITQTNVNTSGRPMSLNQFAGGGTEASQDEEDYTTSDDSDED